MPDYVCFYLNSNSVRASIEDRTSYIEKRGLETIFLDSKRDIGFQKNDKYVIISYSSFNDYEFTEYGVITSIEKLKTSEEGLNTYRIGLKVTKQLTENNLLSELQYSLLKIYNYKKAYRHFTFSYTYLNEDDYYTIIQGNIFISRTAFGKIVNSLPKKHIQNFVISLIGSQGLDFFTQRNYKFALQDLRKYIEEEIENYGKFLIASEEILANSFSELVNIEDIGFLDTQEEKPDYLIQQSSIFRSLFSVKTEYELWNLIDKEISESSEEEYFNYKFSKIDWPIEYE